MVPAYNEERVVLESIRSLLAQRYPRFELVLVDDGSTDATAQIVIDAFGLHPVEPAARNRLDYLPIAEMWKHTGDIEITLVRKTQRRPGRRAQLRRRRRPASVRVRHRR